MTILLLSPLPPPPGGIATWTKNILEYMAANPDGFEIIHQDTAIRSRDYMKTDVFSRMFYGTMEAIKTLVELKENIRKFKPDIIHLTSSSSFALFKDYLIMKIAGSNKIPVLVHWRFGRIPFMATSRNLEWQLLRRVSRGCNMSIVLDVKSFDSLRNAGLSNIILIPNPVGREDEILIGQAAAVNPVKKKGTVLFAGQVIKSKGVYELVEACTFVQQVKELILAGPCDEHIKKELETIGSRREKGEWLRFTGCIDRISVRELMQSSPLVVLPSYTEGFPNVILEAMSMRCAIIATNVGAIPEILDTFSGKPCGICIPPRDSVRLCEAIAALADDPAREMILGKNGASRVMDNYTLGNIMRQYKSVWREILSAV